MPTYDTYPDSSLIQSLLGSVGIEVPEEFDFVPFADAAVSEWERTTGFKPFLAGESGTFLYDPPGPNCVGEARGGARRLFLDRGFISIESITTSGVLRVEGEDYRLRPYNHSADGDPITEIDFVSVQWGRPQCIEVVGVPGYATTIPADAWTAILQLGASYVAKQLAEGVASVGETEIRTEIDTVTWDSSLVAQSGATWAALARRTMLRYIRFS